MALTGYIACSVTCVLVFDGLGASQFGSWSHAETWGLIGLIWLGLLIACPWWLSQFRFGPLEWCWRSLTFRRLQPMRRASASALVD